MRISRESLIRFFLISGLMIRFVTYLVLQPTNPDDHFGVVHYIQQHRSLPLSNEMTHSFHPPLYYLLAAPMDEIYETLRPRLPEFFQESREDFGRKKWVQLLSLLFSATTWLLLVRWVSTSTLSNWSLTALLSLGAFLPQWICFGLFISNDSLAFLWGVLLCILAHDYAKNPTRAKAYQMALVAGLGLLTKGTFLAVVPAVLGMVAWSDRDLSWLRKGAHLFGLGVCMAVVGGYKFYENWSHFGVWMIHNRDLNPEWWMGQIGTIQGWHSWFDFNLGKLMAHPLLHPENRHSVPLLLYGTFWYPMIAMETNLGVSDAVTGGWIPRILYLLGMIPLMVFGFGLAQVFQWNRLSLVQQRLIGFHGIFLFATLAIVFIAGAKYDAWSCFQARLLFAAFGSGLFWLGVGLEQVEKWRLGRWVIGGVILAALLGAFWLGLEAWMILS